MTIKILQLEFDAFKDSIEGLKHKILFPFLFVLYIILVTYSNDFHELHPEYTIRALFGSLFGVISIYYILSQIIDRKLAGITALLCSISFFTFQPQINLLNDLMRSFEAISMNHSEIGWFVALINSLIIGFTLLYLNKKKETQLNIVKYLNLFFAILVAINLVNLGYLALNDFYSGGYENDLELEVNNSEKTPSIYYIVPDKYTNLGGKIPKGALLVGPPGTGKTLLAKAVAGEAGVPFFSLSGSDFVEMFVGVGASRVRDLFKQAKDKSPAIIFIDEIDAIGRSRGKSNFSGSNDERENTLNQLLTEMDGFGTNTNVIVLAATNRADVLDKALMRAGRFDRQIYVDLPDLRERKEIFDVHLKPLKKLDDELDTDFLAKQTPGFSGADIANVCNEAALVAARKGNKSVGKQDFLDAVDRIIGGLEKKNKIMTLDEKKAIAYHEAGHATVSWMLEHAAPLVKVTIVPRGQSLGAAWYLPEERLIVRTEQMLDEMCATMGGRAAEKVIFDKISTGALSDLEKVTKQAKAMVTIYGLNDKVGNLTYYDSSGQSEYNFTKPYSDKTSELIDEEISNIIENQYQRAIQILNENKDKLIELAEILLDKEVIFKDDLEKIFGERPFKKPEMVKNGKQTAPKNKEDLTKTKKETDPTSDESKDDKSDITDEKNGSITQKSENSSLKGASDKEK